MPAISSQMLILASPPTAIQGRDTVSALPCTGFNALLAIAALSVP